MQGIFHAGNLPLRRAEFNVSNADHVKEKPSATASPRAKDPASPGVYHQGIQIRAGDPQTAADARNGPRLNVASSEETVSVKPVAFVPLSAIGSSVEAQATSPTVVGALSVYCETGALDRRIRLASPAITQLFRTTSGRCSRTLLS